MTGYYAGVDLGATNVRAAVADEAGEFVAVRSRATPRTGRGIDVTDAVLSLLRATCEAADVAPAHIEAAGIGSIGPLDLAAGTIENTPNLPAGTGTIPLRDPVSSLLDSERVSLHNDTTAGVIGERFYADHTPDDMVYLTISSGIGAGVAVDGDVLEGWDGNAGEVGHTVVDPDGRRTCGCGHDGHWEAYCSGTHIPEYARDVHEREDVETDLPIGDADFGAADVFAHPEDPLASATIERVAEWNATGVANVVHAYAPLVVAIGGAVALENPGLVIDPIRERVPEMVVSNVPEIRATNLGEEAVLRGAVASAIASDEG